MHFGKLESLRFLQTCSDLLNQNLIGWFENLKPLWEIGLKWVTGP